jgi:hypothetical protein
MLARHQHATAANTCSDLKQMALSAGVQAVESSMARGSHRLVVLTTPRLPQTVSPTI